MDGSPEYSTRRASRALITGFLLRHLTGTTEYDDLLEADAPGATLDLIR